MMTRTCTGWIRLLGLVGLLCAPVPVYAQQVDLEAEAASGNAHAQVAFALALLDGTQIAYDAQRAGALAEAAAAAGNRQGMLLLSSMLEHGLGMDPDPERAAMLLNQAAESGAPDALYLRAMKTVERAPEQALLDFQMAAAQGHVPSLQVLATLRLWDEQAAAGQGDSGAGAAGPDTASAPPNPNVVIAIQVLLAQLGYEVGPPTGTLSEATVAAIRAFQDDSGLPVNGAATAELRNQLAAAVNTR